ncbi:hypothetical protein CkP1_0119 [Citrobacter phage CkP1]|nr:hypothetical protein CkP1_0119 [Citrobacter phage CkP1]
MTEEQKDRLRELIGEVVSYNRDQVWEEYRWDSTLSGRFNSYKNVNEAEEALNTFIEGL